MGKHPKVLIGLVIVVVIALVGSLWNGKHPSTEKAVKHAVRNPFGDAASGDTNNETLRTLTATTQGMQKSQEKMVDSLRQTNANNKKSMDAFEQKVAKQMADWKAQAAHKIQQFQEATQTQQPPTSKKDPYALESKTSKGAVISTVPDITQHTPPAPTVNNASRNGAPQMVNHIVGDASDAAKKLKGIPYYTIPPQVTFGNVAMMSSLMGEVPVSGKLLAPALPFKAIIGHKHMFAANGQLMPEGLAGMVLAGYSIGNQGVGCVSAYVTQILFVFNDGHFVSFPDSKDVKTTSTKVDAANVLGYLSDNAGNACIPYAPHHGKYITNAPQVLGSLAGLAGVAGAGQAIAQSQTQTISNFTQGTTGTILSGSLGKYAAGLAIGNGAEAALDWYKARVADSFDAVYIPGSWRDANGHVHIQRLTFTPTKEIDINLNEHGRKLVYDHSQTSHDSAGLD